MKRFIFIFLLLLTYNICEIQAQNYRIEYWKYFPKEQRFMIEDPRKSDNLSQDFQQTIKNEGFPILRLSNSQGSVLIYWIYIGTFNLSDYYDFDFNNPFPELLPISANYKIRFWWNKDYSQFMKNFGIIYHQKNPKDITTQIDSLIKIDSALLKKSIYPCKQLRHLQTFNLNNGPLKLKDQFFYKS